MGKGELEVMADDGKLIGGFIATIGTALTLFGINVRWVNNLNSKVDNYTTKVDSLHSEFISKDDFTHRIDRLEDGFREDMNRVFDKLEEIKDGDK
jgi:hypothetical protein